VWLFLRGDFVALASELPSVDIVTLDRVICCYPHMEALVAGSASKARRLYGAVFPRERRLMKLAFPVSEIVRRLRGSVPASDQRDRCNLPAARIEATLSP
jgi:magnesium-protoporphyrin O-methyltransferase